MFSYRCEDLKTLDCSESGTLVTEGPRSRAVNNDQPVALLAIGSHRLSSVTRARIPRRRLIFFLCSLCRTSCKTEFPSRKQVLDFPELVYSGLHGRRAHAQLACFDFSRARVCCFLSKSKFLLIPGYKLEAIELLALAVIYPLVSWLFPLAKTQRYDPAHDFT